VFVRNPLHYAVIGVGCTLLLHCIGRLSILCLVWS